MVDYGALKDLRRIKTNLGRLRNARKAVGRVQKTNEVHGLNLWLIDDKLEAAIKELETFFLMLCEKSGWGDGRDVGK